MPHPREPARVIPLNGIEDRDARAVGAKAMNLARMLRLSLPVPRGFCATGAAYREHIESVALAETVGAALAELAAASPESRPDLLSDLRKAIAEAPLSAELEEEIAGRYRALGAGRVAVRSSATAEDLPGRSFAGQYDTFLGVADLEACLRAVKRCWASLWTDRAFGYREKHGIEHAGVDMATVVQEMVPADASGVLFTADPVTGGSDRIVIEGSFGLGEAVVQGKVTPDRIVLSKRGPRVLERATATKTVEIVPDGRGGVRERPLAPTRADEPVIDDRAARRLAKLALKIEKAFGAPQDVEWAVSAGEIHILQSRPVTAIKSWEDRQVWTNANTGEVLPDVATPFTWSAVEFMLDTIFRALFERLGFDLRGARPIKLIAGRAYFNINTLIGMAVNLPFVRNIRAEITKVLGGNRAAIEALERVESDMGGVPRVRLSRLRMLLRLPGLVRWMLWHSPERAEMFLRAKRKKTELLRRLDPRALSDLGMARLVKDAAYDLCRTPTGLVYPIIGMHYFMLLAEACRRWFADDGGIIARRLVMALDGMQPAEAGLDLWRLAELAHEQRTVEAAVLSGESFEIVRERIARERGGEEFLSRWDAFMYEHGHHTRGELEYMNPRWRERPDDVLAMVRGYLRSVQTSDPVARQRGLAAERRALARRCRKKLWNPVKRIVFDLLLGRAQRGAVVRENTKSEAVRRIAVMRSMLLELGRRLARRGDLDEAEDVFFLRYDELGPVLRGEQEFDVGVTVAGRRAEYERNLAITPPSVIVGRFDPDAFVPDAVDEGARTLSGVAASPGVAEGRARVILRAGAGQVLPGEILVAPFTDPGWTPYFLNAAAIVMDMGGLLSHGSIIAREYGVPAVVNVGPATKIIKTGRMIRVDGNRGVVKIL